jgi:hypothetical protein
LSFTTEGDVEVNALRSTTETDGVGVTVGRATVGKAIGFIAGANAGADELSRVSDNTSTFGASTFGASPGMASLEITPLSVDISLGIF